MAIERVFIDPQLPILQEVAERMVRLSPSADFPDLSSRIVVFPGSQAGRRFLELLANAAHGAFSPPKILTVGQLPEELYRPKFPFASALTQRLAWAKALQNFPEDRLSMIVRWPPDPEDLRGWIALGELFRRQHAELAGDLLDFGDVAERGASLPEFQEQERWRVLTELQRDYWNLLDAMEVWDRQTARLVAIERRECQTERRIDLVGTVDLNLAIRGMLAQVAHRVTAYIHAPPAWESRFDEFGCLVPDVWSDLSVDIDHAQVRVADSPADQVECVIRELATWGADYSISDITVGVPDDSVVLPLRRRLDEFHIPTDWPLENLLATSPPFRLLDAVADFLRSRSPVDFSALIRHPDLTCLLDRKFKGRDWLGSWQRSFQDHLHQRTDRLIVTTNDDEQAQRLVEAVDRLLKPLRGKPRALREWGEPVEQVLQEIFGRRVATEEDADSLFLLNSCARITAAFAEHGDIPGPLDPRCSAADAIRLTLDEIRAESVAADSGSPGLRLSGWLDLPLDDAPALIMTSFNEGVIPSSVNHDPFLPNRLRRHLGIEDNSRRFARDLYALQCLLSGKKLLRLIVGRRNGAGDPLAPSRLLFATDPETVARRVLDFYGSAAEGSPTPPPIGAVRPGRSSQFQVPRPPAGPSDKCEFRVTEFKDYLVSPYRYYLRHILGLADVGDAIGELDALAFGNLIHDVLKEFGESPHRDLDDPEELARQLIDMLFANFANRYGDGPSSALRLQLKQAELRMRAFADWQANWRRQGWEIREVERSVADVPFALEDGRVVRIKGRIDRIDFHPATGEWAVFDYKTGEKGKDPDKAHRQGEEWVDFQLPLYRHLVTAAGIQGPLRLGYLAIPRDTNDIKESFAEWTESDLRDADAAAARIAAAVIDGEFWRELPHDPGWLSEYDAICQTGVFSREVIV